MGCGCNSLGISGLGFARVGEGDGTTTPSVVKTDNIITGVSDTYIYIGGAALALLLIVMVARR